MNGIKAKKIDKVFLGLSVLLVSTGLFVFTSASFGLIFRKGFTLWDVFFDQFVLGFLLGIIALILVLYLPMKLLRAYALYIFIASLVLALLAEKAWRCSPVVKFI